MSDFYIPNMSKPISLHNEARKNSNSNLIADDRLMIYASDWAKYMSDKNKLTHSRMKDIMNLGFSRVGENIAYGQRDEESVIRTWLRSPGHRSNIMNFSFTKIGCDFSYSKNGTTYWCVCFAS